MKCEAIGNELIAYMDRRSSPAERREIEAHLAGCAACRTRAEEYRKVGDVLGEMPAIEPSFAFDARLRQRIAAEPHRRSWFSFIPQPRLALSAALLVALAVLVVRLPYSHVPPPPTISEIQQQDFNAIKDLGVLEDYDVVTKMDALSELAPTNDSQPAETPQGQSSAND